LLIPFGKTHAVINAELPKRVGSNCTQEEVPEQIENAAEGSN